MSIFRTMKTEYGVGIEFQRRKINMTLVNMLDAFFTDASYSSGSNFDDSEKTKMLRDNGA